MPFRCLPYCVPQRHQAHRVTSCVVRMEGFSPLALSGVVQQDCSSTPTPRPHSGSTRAAFEVSQGIGACLEFAPVPTWVCEGLPEALRITLAGTCLPGSGRGGCW